MASQNQIEPRTVGRVHKPRFRIVDWAGNDKTAYYGTFKTYQDAWSALYKEFDQLPEKEFEEQMGEFYVERAS